MLRTPVYFGGKECTQNSKTVIKVALFNFTALIRFYNELFFVYASAASHVYTILELIALFPTGLRKQISACVLYFGLLRIIVLFICRERQRSTNSKFRPVPDA